MELNYAGIEQVPVALQRDVLAFDWWIHNIDRMLTESGGNPNLFWAPEQAQLVVIDHNQAFDPQFSVKDFFDYHVFSQNYHALFDDALHRQKYQKAFQKALNKWTEFCDNLPEEWHFLDAGLSIPSDISIDAIFSLLNRCHTDTLWNTL